MKLMTVFRKPNGSLFLEKIMVDSKYVSAVSFKLDYSCNSLSFNVDMFATCKQVKGIVFDKTKTAHFSNDRIKS